MTAGTEEGHGRAGPGEERTGGEKKGDEEGCGWWGRRGGGGIGGVAAQPLLPERSLWLAAGAAGSSGLQSAFARLSAATSGQFPSASASVLAVAAVAARSRRHHQRRAQSPPPPRLSERRRRQIFSPVLATGRGACREMQSQVWGAGGERRKRPVSREEGPEREREM